MVLAIRMMPPMEAPTATRDIPIGTIAATTVPKTTSSTTSATSNPMAVWNDVSSAALRKTASPPSSTWRPGAPIEETASDRTPNAGLPISRSGASSVMTANPIRPSAEIVADSNGSATDSTWATPETSSSTWTMVSWCSSSVVPSPAASTTMAEPLAASGKFSSSSSSAVALWLPGEEKSSTNVPPAAMARKKTAPMTASQLVMVRHGCLALADAMPRVSFCMIVPFWSRVGWCMARNLGSDVVRADHHRW